MNSSLPFERLSDSRTLLPFDCGDEDIYQHTGDSWGTKIIDYIKHWMVSENKIGFVSPERRYEAPTVARPPQM